MSLPLIIHPEINESSLKAKGVSLVAFCDTVRKRKDGTCSIRLRIIYDRVPKLYSSKINVTEDDYLKMCGSRPRGRLKEHLMIVHVLLKRAYKIILNLDVFSFEEFDALYKTKGSRDASNIYQWYVKKMDELDLEGQTNTSDNYLYSMNSLKSFSKRMKYLSFKEITPAFLNKYENWMINEGKSPTSVGIYLRPLRHIFNNAINDNRKFLSKDDYPFDKYSIPAAKNIKKALTKTEVKNIFLYQPIPNSPEHFYKDLWVFTYLCNGINMKDICLLKYQNINGNTIEFVREKTKKTRKNVKPIVISINQHIKNIIEVWGVKPEQRDNFIFPIISRDASPIKAHALIKRATKQCNKYIKRVAQKVGINKNITTYTARHSYATILKNEGVSPYFIGESMGHSSTSTTDNYFGSFEDDQRNEYTKKLTDW